MEDQDNTQSGTKLIFGLSPFATLINSILVIFFSALLNAAYFCVNYAESELAKDATLETPWYIAFPLFFLSWIMLSRYVTWRYGLVVGKVTFKDFLIKTIYIIFLVLLENILKAIFVYKLITVL